MRARLLLPAVPKLDTLRGMRLSDYLQESGLSAAEFGRKAGITHRVTMSRYVRGLRIPRPDEMGRITAASEGAVTANDFYAAYAEAVGREDAA